MEIRDARPEEWQIVGKIANASGLFNYRLFYKYLAEQKTVLVSVNDQGTIVGYTAYFLLPFKSSFSLQTGILPEFQGFGVGSDLFETLLVRLKSIDNETLYAHTFKSRIAKWLSKVYKFKTVWSIPGMTTLKKDLKDR